MVSGKRVTRLKYSKEKQYCFRLNLSRPEHERLCSFIEYRNKEKYPFLASYLLAACESLEKKDEKAPESILSKKSMQEIRSIMIQVLTEQFAEKEKSQF